MGSSRIAWPLLLGLLVGAGGSFYAMVRRLNADQKRADEAAAAAKAERERRP